jgi:hypothetical protein
MPDGGKAHQMLGGLALLCVLPCLFWLLTHNTQYSNILHICDTKWKSIGINNTTNNPIENNPLKRPYNIQCFPKSWLDKVPWQAVTVWGCHQVQNICKVLSGFWVSSTVCDKYAQTKGLMVKPRVQSCRSQTQLPACMALLNKSLSFIMTLLKDACFTSSVNVNQFLMLFPNPNDGVHWFLYWHPVLTWILTCLWTQDWLVSWAAWAPA